MSSFSELCQVVSAALHSAAEQVKTSIGVAEIRTVGRAQVRYADFIMKTPPKGRIRVIRQNDAKSSVGGHLARAGHEICWIVRVHSGNRWEYLRASHGGTLGVIDGRYTENMHDELNELAHTEAAG